MNYGECTGPETFYAVYYQSDYTYKGRVQTFTAPVDGYYRFSCWGAPGGVASGGTVTTGGGYAAGTIYCKKGEGFDIYVGGAGQYGTSGGGWPNGGNGGSGAFGGGGSTDIRIKGSGLYGRLMVAGGGGGYHCSVHPGGYGGGLVAGTTNTGVPGATYRGGYMFGQGQHSYLQYGGGGGGGYYGGYSANQQYSGGSGGSGYISGYGVCGTHSSGKKFTNASMANDAVNGQNGRAQCLLLQ